ncbi:MAG: hypothetical protein HKN85_08365 [Gammaproteobacteria bacterium]|nr:hypothetical protein [Gammaproteobacteria bacterium]
MNNAENSLARVPWDKGKFIGQRPALKLHEVWAIRVLITGQTTFFSNENNAWRGVVEIVERLSWAVKCHSS